MLASQPDAPPGTTPAKIDEYWSQFDPFRASFSGRERDRLFMRLGHDEAFVDLAPVLGVDHPGDSRSAVAADLDGDGDLDLVVRAMQPPRLRVLRNDAVAAGAVEVRVGPPSRAPGTIVRAQGERPAVAAILLGDGFLSHGPARALLGVGGGNGLQDLVVTGPRGERVEVGDVPAGSVVTVTFPPGGTPGYLVAGRPRATQLGGTKAIDPGPACDLAWMRRRTASGADTWAKDARPLLVNLWAPWCKPCLEELPALQRWQKKHPEVRVVALAVDGTEKEVRRTLKRRRITLPAPRLADGAVAEKGTELAIPTTCRFDANGALERGWEGAVEW